MLQEEGLSGLIKEWVIKNHKGYEIGAPCFTDNDDLLANGALDSMGFVELLVYVESMTGKQIDLTDLDPNEFTSIKGLSRSLLNSWTRTA